MRLLRVPLQYPREASTLEPRGAKVARAATISERMEERADIGAAWEVRSGIVRVGLQTDWNQPTRGSHRASKAYTATKSW